MISQKISRGNSGDGFDDAIVDSDQGKDDKWQENIKESILVTVTGICQWAVLSRAMVNSKRQIYSKSILQPNPP